MSGSLIWHDARLAGTADPLDADLVVRVDGSTPLGVTLSRIGDFANGRRGLDRISIMCHGYQKVHASASQQQSIMVGGRGLQLCREDLTHGNVVRTSVLKGFVSEIIVYACGAADTHEDLAGTAWDGRRLFGELALYTGAVVYAADVTQWYWRESLPNASAEIINFRGWEGNLWRFAPDGSPATIVESNPITAR